MPGPLVYADHHATTPVRPEVTEAMLPWLTGLAANPSSVHAPGRAARRAVEEARENVARLLGASPREIVFTSGGTESVVLAVRGAAFAAREADPGRRRVAVTAVEHASVREAALGLAPLGFEPAEVPVDRNGRPRDGAFEPFLDGGTAVVSAILASNETGVVFHGLPLLSGRARRAGVVVHTDAVQAVGKVPVEVGSLGVDLLSLSAHKLGGPKGAGALWVRQGVKLVPLQKGGGQERGRRGGTEDVAALVGLGAAAGIVSARMAAESAAVRSLRDRFEAGLEARIPGARVNGREGEPGDRLPTVTSATFPGADGEVLLAALDLAGVAASAGSACAAGTTAPSRILLALGLSTVQARATLRFSFGWSSTDQDVDRLLELLPPLVSRASGGRA